MSTAAQQDPSYVDPFRHAGLPEDACITFTHGDLNPCNILVTPPPSDGQQAKDDVRVVAIIDWEYTGWYPDYWEYCKAMFTVHWEDDWVVNGLPQVLDVKEKEERGWWEYINAMGVI